MTDTRNKRADGVRTLQDLKDRCRVDAETGCWIWSLAISDNGKTGSSRTPRVSMPTGVISEKRITSTAARASWLLSGKKLGDKQVVWRTCLNEECCAPNHLKAGTKAEEGAWMTASGHRRGNPERAAVNLRNVLKMATPPDVVRQVEALFAAGTLQKDVQAATGLRPETLRSIRLGCHVNSTKRQQVVAQASVFALGRLAA